MRVFLILFFCIYSNFLFAEILVFKNCKSKNYEFEKNEYRLDIDQGLMTREFVYTDETYERLRFDDIRVKKENETTRVIIRENGLIISEISGYPAFYTQMIFDTFDKTIKLINLKKLGVVIIRNKKNETTGIFTDGDIKRTIQKKSNFKNLLIKSFMSKNPISINKDMLAAKAIGLMNEKKITSLCVHNKSNKKKTIGILHIHNLIDADIS